jgi:hypothetical protein
MKYIYFFKRQKVDKGRAFRRPGREIWGRGRAFRRPGRDLGRLKFFRVTSVISGFTDIPSVITEKYLIKK